MTDSEKRARRRDLGVTALALLVLALLVWQAWRYIGLIQDFAEWQFEMLDIYLPTASVLLLLAIAMLPVAAILFGLHWRRRRRQPATTGEVVLTPGERLARVAIESDRLNRLLQIAAVAALLTSLLFCLRAWAVPPPDDRPVFINGSSQGASREGPARMTGAIDSGHVALLTQRVVLLRRDLYVAAVGRRVGAPTRYFAQVAPLGAGLEPMPSPLVGQLSRVTFPKETVALFDAAGITVHPQPYVLYRSSGPLQWPFWASASQFLVVGLLSFIFSQIFRWRARRLRERLASIDEPKRLTHR